MRGKKALYRDINGIIEKQCTKCGKWFPNTEEHFYKLKCVCKICLKEQRKIYRDNNKEKIKQYEKMYTIKNKEKQRKKDKLYYANNKEKERERKFKQKYNLSLDEYNAMLKNQDNKCLICGNELKDKQKIHIDHCHKTGKVRGILCARCNTRLELVENHPEIIQSMFTYLELHKSS